MKEKGNGYKTVVRPGLLYGADLGKNETTGSTIRFKRDEDVQMDVRSDKDGYDPI